MDTIVPSQVQHDSNQGKTIDTIVQAELVSVTAPAPSPADTPPDTPPDTPAETNKETSADTPSMKWYYCDKGNKCCSVTELEPPTLFNVKQFVPSVGKDTWIGVINRFAAFFVMGGFLTEIDCWLVHSFGGIDAIVTVLSLCSVVLLNSVKYETLTHSSDKIRRRAMILIFICYMVFFVAAFRSSWDPLDHALGSSCVINCCKHQELTFAMGAMLGATILRFVGHSLQNLWDDNENQRSVRPPSWLIVVLAIIAALTIVAGLMCLCMGIYGPQGSKALLLAPLAYIAPFPVLIMVRLQRMANRNSTVWKTWNDFTPMCVYILAVGWPVCLGRSGRLTKDQEHLAVASAIGVVGGCRLAIYTLDLVSRDQTNSGSGAYFGTGGYTIL